jgi:hypothetical protein
MLEYRTVDDYEALRKHTAKGDGGATEDAESDLASFVANGVAIWLCCKRRHAVVEETSSRSWEQHRQSMNVWSGLAVLIANMIEEASHDVPGKQQDHKHAPRENSYTVYQAVDCSPDI